MDPSPEEDIDTACADCGAPLAVALERGYPFGDERALCFDCAGRRGGVYDEVHDHWTQPPNLAGLWPVSEELGTRQAP